MSGRSRRKKLQRAKRISQADSFASPSLESGGTTNPPFPFPSSDTITSLSTNEADLEDITSSKSEEKLERTTTSTELVTSNKETGEKETEGNEEKSSSTISNQVQPQPLIPCGPIEIKVDSLQKTVDSDESAAIDTLNEINSRCEVSSENCASKLIRINESNENVDSLHIVDESKGDNNNTDHTEKAVPLSLSTIQKVKSGGRITIAKSDTIIETREELSDSDVSDIDTNVADQRNKIEDNSDPKVEDVDLHNIKSEDKLFCCI